MVARSIKTARSPPTRCARTLSPQTATGEPADHPDIVALLAKATTQGKVDMLTSFAPHWTATSEDGMPSTDAILRMQDYWVDYFHLATEKLSTSQLFDLSIAKEAKERLDRDHPFDH
jgi:hypothetical protein